MKNKNLLSLLCLLFFVVIAIASGPSKDGMTTENNQIPPEFGAFNGTLLVIKQSNSWNSYFKKHFNKNYSGKYIFVGETEVDTKYLDKNQYRYLLSRTLGYSDKRSPGAQLGSTYASSESIFIEDRLTGKKYATASTAFYSKLLQAYSISLEETRKNNTK